MKFNRCFLLLLYLLFFLFSINCFKEGHIHSSNILGDEKADTLLINDISGITYQISPEIGSFNKLYIGKKDDFIFPYSLFKFSDDSWDIFSDSSTVIDSLFFKVFSGDSLISPSIDLTLFFDI